MALSKGTASVADHKLFDTCDPVILKIGRHERRCGTVPRVSNLFIGYGWFAAPKQIDKEWATLTWTAWLDGRRVQLPAFGTSDRTLYAFPAAAGKDVTLREWKVMLRHATPGRHTVRYRIGDPHGVTDATWAFTVAR
jgi:hypothetical protein